MKYYSNKSTNPFLNIQTDILHLKTNSNDLNTQKPEIKFSRYDASGFLKDTTSMYHYYNSYNGQYNFRFENLYQYSHFDWMINNKTLMTLGHYGALNHYDNGMCLVNSAKSFYWKIGGTTKMWLSNNGNLYLYSGGTFNPSDFRIKDNIRDYATDINCYKNIKIRNYNRKENDVKNELAVIAQELKEVLPECVNINTSMNGEIEDFHYIDTNKIMMNTVSVVPQLIKRIEISEAKIENKI